MRKLYFMIMAMLISMPIYAQEEQEEENPGGWDFTLPINLDKYKPHDSNRNPNKGYLNLSSYFSVGFIGAVNADDAIDLNMGESFELEWGYISSAKARLGKYSFLRIGWGFDWKNYRMTNRQQFIREKDGGVSLKEYPEGAEPKFSRIKTFGINVPLKFYQMLGTNSYISFGPELEYITYASLKTRYTQNDEKQKLVEKNIKINHFSFGVGAELSIRDICVYYKYTPTSVLQHNFGPKFGSQTVGLRIDL